MIEQRPPTDTSPLPLHDALPISMDSARIRCAALVGAKPAKEALPRSEEVLPVTMSAPPVSAILGADQRARCSSAIDRKSTRLNSSHRTISYAVFCLKKKK